MSKKKSSLSTIVLSVLTIVSSQKLHCARNNNLYLQNLYQWIKKMYQTKTKQISKTKHVYKLYQYTAPTKNKSMHVIFLGC